MSLRIYSPKTRTFGNVEVPAGDLPLSEVLLLNILMELQTISVLLAEDAPNLPSGPLESIRADQISN